MHILPTVLSRSYLTGNEGNRVVKKTLFINQPNIDDEWCWEAGTLGHRSNEKVE